MQQSRAREQHIAVFGESGSGKTVLLSSFYGATQQPEYKKKSLFRVVADNATEGSRLIRNYVGMRDSAQLPDATHFSGKSYCFSVRLKSGGDAKAIKAKPFDALRLVWHDYPGEWFEQDVNGTEAQRRTDTFRKLLSSDVALLLVDGKKLLDNSGYEERYLKSLLTNVSNGLLSIKDDLLEDGKPLRQFPRIWIIALSKSDLLPDLSVSKFRDLLAHKALEDIEELRTVLAELVESSDALSVGEDFVLLSSARFDAGRIEVTERVGLELILPVASMLPLERHLRWAQLQLIPGKVGDQLLRKAKTLALAAALMGSKGKLPGQIGLWLSRLDPTVLDHAAKLASEQLRRVNSEALAKRDYLTATLTRFQLDLDEGEEKQILLRSLR